MKCPIIVLVNLYDIYSNKGNLKSNRKKMSANTDKTMVRDVERSL